MVDFARKKNAIIIAIKKLYFVFDFVLFYICD